MVRYVSGPSLTQVIDNRRCFHPLPLDKEEPNVEDGLPSVFIQGIADYYDTDKNGA
ncbi:hypothetical protein BJY00DRAFT_278814 [Aspergillus carlsbadensis]|nr:hypothetical protein BJY00DRAFT_278814 [Aspergillus carlsbadensis]